MNVRSSAVLLLALAVTGTCTAQEGGSAAGWEADLERAVDRAWEERKLILQFRLIGRFDRPDC
jgi:hypothetical protein